MHSSCIFCKIAAGEIPATVLHRDDELIAIADVNAQAPQHVLVMPIRHVANLGDFVASEDAARVGELFALAAKLGRETSPEGFRLVVNTGFHGGQTVEHLHVHVLGGRQMHWPPG
jgi:histidine triad (HIT) family protein